MFLRATTFSSYSEPGTLHCNIGENQQEYPPPMISPFPLGSSPLPHLKPPPLIFFCHNFASKSTSTKTETLYAEEVFFQRKVTVWGQTKLRNCNRKICYGIFFILYICYCTLIR